MTAIATDRSYSALQDIQARVGAMDHPIITYTTRSHPDGRRKLWPIVWRRAQFPAGWIERSADGGETWFRVPPGARAIPRTVRRRLKIPRPSAQPPQARALGL
jgi:hypothetical protein